MSPMLNSSSALPKRTLIRRAPKSHLEPLVRYPSHGSQLHFRCQARIIRLLLPFPSVVTILPVIKLALLIPTLDRSGAEKQLTLLATRLPRTQFDVHVIALTRGGPFARVLAEADIPVTLLCKRWKFDISAWYRLSSWLRRNQPDILHTWLFAANSYGRLAARRSSPLRVIVSERCVDTWKADWQHWLDRKLIGRTDRLVGNSQSVAAYYTEQGFPPDRISVIPNGIEAAPSESIDREELLKQLNLPLTTRLVGYVGRLAAQKRIQDLLWGIQLLRQADECACLLIVGEGPERERLVQHARDVECADFVRFLGHRKDADALMPCLDAFWLGSDFEGMSNSLMEAMVQRVPCVVTDIPANRELIDHGKHGFLVGVGDGVGFAQFTARLLQDPELAQTITGNAAGRMREEFSVERMVNAHIDLYHEVIQSRNRETTLTPVPSVP